jgi:glutaconate CoA-transferase subunit B
MRVDYVVRAIAELLNDGELVYVGLNSGPAILGAFMARDLMKKDIDIVGVAEAFNPKSITLSPSTGDPFFLEGSPVMITVDSFDLAQKGELDVMFLGPAQIDEETNVNLTAIGDYERPKVKLPGGAATAYLMPLVKKMILWNLKHSKRSGLRDWIRQAVSKLSLRRLGYGSHEIRQERKEVESDRTLSVVHP